MPLSKDQMREYQRARRAKFAALKENPDLKVVDKVAPVIEQKSTGQDRMVRDAVAAFSGHVADLKDRVETLEHAVIDLQTRTSEIECQLSPEEVTRRQALKPGARPSELYGA